MLSIDEVLEDIANADAFKNIREINVNCIGINGETPLHWMASLGDLNATNLLIEAGAQITAIDNNGNTALHYAVTSKQAHMIQPLILSGINVSVRNEEGLTVKDIAVLNGYEPCVSQLIGDIGTNL